MPVITLVDCYVELNSVDMSNHVTAVQLDLEKADQPTTNFGSGGWEERITGLGSGTVQVSFNADFAAGQVDDLLWPLFMDRNPTGFKIRPTAAVVSATNPSYEGSVSVDSLTPVAGSVGDLATQDLTWPTSGVVNRVTA